MGMGMWDEGMGPGVSFAVRPVDCVDILLHGFLILLRYVDMLG